MSAPRDQKDAIFLACALSAGADYLITGDKDFSAARNLLQTTILSVTLFRRLMMPPEVLPHEGAESNE